MLFCTIMYHSAQSFHFKASIVTYNSQIEFHLREYFLKYILHSTMFLLSIRINNHKTITQLCNLWCFSSRDLFLTNKFLTSTLMRFIGNKLKIKTLRFVKAMSHGNTCLSNYCITIITLILPNNILIVMVKFRLSIIALKACCHIAMYSHITFLYHG